MTRSGAVSATLHYDPLGRLLQVVSGGTTRRFLHDGSDLVAIYNGSGAMTNRYVHGEGAGDDPLVQFFGSVTADGNIRHLYTDERGSIVLMTDSAGVKTTRNTYDPYGVPGSSNAGVFQYTGQLWLPELGMYYYKARMYSPLLGRFMQTDPIGYGDGMNMYAYVGNDPLNLVDPSGKNGGCFTLTYSNQSRGSAVSTEPARNDDGTMSDASGGSESDASVEYYTVTICTNGTISFGTFTFGGDTGGGGSQEKKKKRELTPCEKERLAPYIPAVDLNAAVLYAGKVPWYVGANTLAITRGRRIYFRPDAYSPSTSAGLALLGHELVHVGQYRAGATWASFLLSYARHGYWNSPLEVAARKVEDTIRRDLEQSGSTCGGEAR